MQELSTLLATVAVLVCATLAISFLIAGLRGLDNKLFCFLLAALFAFLTYVSIPLLTQSYNNLRKEPPHPTPDTLSTSIHPADTLLTQPADSLQTVKTLDDPAPETPTTSQN